MFLKPITSLQIRQIKYKSPFLFALVLGCGCLLFMLDNASLVDIIDNNDIDSRDATGTHSKVHNVYTNICSIPHLDPHHYSMRPYSHYPHVKPCTVPEHPPLLASNDTHIWTIAANVHFYKPKKVFDLYCCYRGFYRTPITSFNYTEVDTRVKYDSCIFFNSHITVTHEFVNVICVSKVKKKILYKDYFVFTPLKNVDSKATGTAPEKDDFSVIVMGIDGVSRMNFHRTMPRTLDFLKRKRAIDLTAYNKVGDNTFPNLVPVLMGFPEDDLQKICYPYSNSTFDDCPFLWDRYKKAGYVTAFAEDSSRLSTFNYFKNGFAKTPTDYYLYTFINEAEKKIGHYKFNTDLCMGHRYFYQVLLDYILSLANALTSVKLFGFFWEVSMSHDHVNYPMVMDNSYLNFLKTMEKRGHLDRTVLVLMSDHGFRWGNIRRTKQGRIEERLPFVYLIFPPKFAEKYSAAYDNLRTNSRRLSTPFDLHETLSDLTDPSRLEDEWIASRSRTAYGDARGISLFLPVPANRSCESAHIAEHWCTCHRSRPLATSGGHVEQASYFLLRWLNAAVAQHRQCAPLRLELVLEASEVLMSSSALLNASHAWRDFTLVVRVSPSSAVFEATLRREERGVWRLVGSVSRLDLYGEQSACVHDHRIKLYCYCLKSSHDRNRHGAIMLKFSKFVHGAVSAYTPRYRNKQQLTKIIASSDLQENLNNSK